MNVDFLVGDCEKVSHYVPKHSVDYAVDIEGFFYYPDKEAYLREVHHVLKDDGTLILAFFTFKSDFSKLHSLIKRYFDIEKEEDIT